MARYLLIVTFEPGIDETPMEEWEPAEVTAHLDYYRALNDQLTESGELVDHTILTPPDAAHVVRAGGTAGAAGRVVTDGPFQEFKEWVAGFQVIDVETGSGRSRSRPWCQRCPGGAGSRSDSPSTSAGSWTTWLPTPTRCSGSSTGPVADADRGFRGRDRGCG